MSDAMVKISQALQEIADEIDKRIAEIVGERVAFSLFVFSDSRYQYISTAARQEVAQVLRDCLANWDAGAPDIKAHEVN